MVACLAWLLGSMQHTTIFSTIRSEWPIDQEEERGYKIIFLLPSRKNVLPALTSFSIDYLVLQKPQTSRLPAITTVLRCHVTLFSHYDTITHSLSLVIHRFPFMHNLAANLHVPHSSFHITCRLVSVSRFLFRQ